MNKISLTIDGVEHIVSYEIFGDEVVICLPDGSVPPSVFLRSGDGAMPLTISTLVRPVVVSWLKGQDF